MCTDKSSQSVGLVNYGASLGGSYRYYADLNYIGSYFGSKFYNGNKWKISNYTHKIFQIQRFVFEQQRVFSYIDILPYNDAFISYLMTLIPIFHPCGKVIAIQSIATMYRFVNFREHLAERIDKIESPPSEFNLSPREHEIMFLLANGITQEQIAQILHISRSTIAAIIRNQLCLKFNIAGSNTKMLAELSVRYGYYKNIPSSLFYPAVITLDEELDKWLELHNN
jgi:DNA-binding CsgD family transcriptional regulator